VKMAFFAVKTRKDDMVKEYVKKSNARLKEPNWVVNPMQGKIRVLENKDNYVVFIGLEHVLFKGLFNSWLGKARIFFDFKRGLRKAGYRGVCEKARDSKVVDVLAEALWGKEKS